MKSLRKKPADTLEGFLARVEECTANLGKLQDNVSFFFKNLFEIVPYLTMFPGWRAEVGASKGTCRAF